MFASSMAHTPSIAKNSIATKRLMEAPKTQRFEEMYRRFQLAQTEKERMSLSAPQDRFDASPVIGSVESPIRLKHTRT